MRQFVVVLALLFATQVGLAQQIKSPRKLENIHRSQQTRKITGEMLWLDRVARDAEKPDGTRWLTRDMDLTQVKDALEHNLHNLSWLHTSNLKPGRIGYLWNGRKGDVAGCEILRIHGDDLIARLMGPETTVVISGFDVSEFVDGEKLLLNIPLEVLAPKKIGPQTLRHLKRFDANELKTWTKSQKK